MIWLLTLPVNASYKYKWFHPLRFVVGFYDEQRFAIIPTGLCYPGRGRSGDLPPRPECAPTWHPRLRALLPNIGLSAGYNYGDANVKFQDSALGSVDRNPRDWNYTLSLTQPIFRKDNWLRRDQAEFQVRQAEATFEQARQDLILRAAQAYFDVLAAQATLTVV